MGEVGPHGAADDPGIVVGPVAAAVIALQSYSNAVVDPTANGPLPGILMAAGLGLRVAVAMTGAVTVAREHGIRTPPIWGTGNAPALDHTGGRSGPRRPHVRVA